MRIAILMTNTDESEFATRHPKDGDKWCKLLSPKRPDWTFTVYNVKDGDFPQDLSQHDGWIITGSPASVHDGTPWIVDLLALIRDINACRAPLFGACFGHQAIAMALGGSVGTNPNGWVFGATETQITAPPSWMRARRIWQYAAHIEQVTTLPDEAQIIMSHPGCPVGGMAIGDHVFTTQNHPEMTDKFIAALVEELAESKPKDVIERARSSLKLGADNSIFADWILKFFEIERSTARRNQPAINQGPPKDPSP